jgi:hypothetical protein
MAHFEILARISLKAKAVWVISGSILVFLVRFKLKLRYLLEIILALDL